MVPHITLINVMCTVWTLIDWLRQITVIRFYTRVSIPNNERLAAGEVINHLIGIYGGVEITLLS